MLCNFNIGIRFLTIFLAYSILVNQAYARNNALISRNNIDEYLKENYLKRDFYLRWTATYDEHLIINTPKHITDFFNKTIYYTSVFDSYNYYSRNEIIDNQDLIGVISFSTDKKLIDDVILRKIDVVRTFSFPEIKQSDNCFFEIFKGTGETSGLAGIIIVDPDAQFIAQRDCGKQAILAFYGFEKSYFQYLDSKFGERFDLKPEIFEFVDLMNLEIASKCNQQNKKEKVLSCFSEYLDDMIK